MWRRSIELAALWAQSTNSSSYHLNLQPLLEGKLLVAVDSAPWFVCGANCTLENTDQSEKDLSGTLTYPFIAGSCLCQLKVLFDGKEEVRFNATDIGLTPQAHVMEYIRDRSDPLKVYHGILIRLP